MIIQTIYIANDGTRFSTAEECAAYEEETDLSMIPMLKWPDDDTNIPQKAENIRYCRYVYLKDKEMTDRFLAQLNRFGRSEKGIDGPGLYFLDDDGRWWVLFDIHINEIKKELAQLEKISKELLTMAKDKEE